MATHWDLVWVHLNEIVDLSFVADVDTPQESPIGQVAMISMLAWNANSTLSHLMVTLFCCIDAAIIHSAGRPHNRFGRSPLSPAGSGRRGNLRLLR